MTAHLASSPNVFLLLSLMMATVCEHAIEHSQKVNGLNLLLLLTTFECILPLLPTTWGKLKHHCCKFQIQRSQGCKKLDVRENSQAKESALGLTACIHDDQNGQFYYSAGLQQQLYYMSALVLRCSCQYSMHTN